MKLLREPLVHFVLLGAAIFIASSFTSESRVPRDDDIVVTPGNIEHLITIFSRTWQRPPTREELDGIVRDHVQEEAAYREGMAMGLDADDTIIRRRIRQKLDFIAQDVMALADPADEALQAFLDAHPENFATGPFVTFDHVYLSPDKRGSTLESDARILLAQLQRQPDTDATQLGDRIALDTRYEALTPQNIRALFGDRFAEAIAMLETGAWHGPVVSGYGVHLVRVTNRVDAHVPALDEVREAVRREWEHAALEATTDQFYRELVAGYRVRIEWPQGLEPELTAEQP